MNTEQVMKLCHRKGYKLLKANSCYYLLLPGGESRVRLRSNTGRACCARLEHYVIRPGANPGESIYSCK